MPIPDYIEKRADETLVRWIIARMKRHHTGQGRAATRWAIVREVFGDDADGDLKIERLLRRCFELANHDYQGLIVSSPGDGYWWADSVKDIDYIEKTESRAKTILENCSVVKRNITTAYGGQFGLF